MENKRMAQSCGFVSRNGQVCGGIGGQTVAGLCDRHVSCLNQFDYANCDDGDYIPGGESSCESNLPTCTTNEFFYISQMTNQHLFCLTCYNNYKISKFSRDGEAWCDSNKLDEFMPSIETIRFYNKAIQTQFEYVQ